MKLTWTGLPDLPDTPNTPLDIEAEQEQNLIDAIGLAKYGDLEMRLMEEENVRTHS